MANTRLDEELAEARNMLAFSKNAYETALKTGRSWSMRDGESTKEVTNESLSQLRKDYLFWKNRVSELEVQLGISGSSSSGKALRIGVLF